MHQLTPQAILDIGGPRASPAIAAGIVNSLAWLDAYGISAPARLAHFLAQCGEESDHFFTTVEEGRDAGAAYEGRRDLGNIVAGDGRKFKGRGIIQTTGHANYRAFMLWIGKQVPGAPDFIAQPDLLATFPWALYSAAWYWQSHDLNRLADDDNVEAITHKINGGLNGLGERLVMLGRASLCLLDYGAGELKRFQADAGLAADGILGAKTRVALHAKLAALPAPEPAALAVHAPPAAPLAADAPAAVRPPPAPTAAAMPTLAVAVPAPPAAARWSWWRFLRSLI